MTYQMRRILFTINQITVIMKKMMFMKRKRVENEDECEEEAEIRCKGVKVYFYADVSPKTILQLIDCLDEAAANAVKYRAPMSDPKVYLFIHSDGGDAYSGLAARTHIQLCPVQVVTIADGFVASAATLLLLSSKERYIVPNSNVLIHQLRTSFWGKFDELLDEVNNSKQVMKSIVDIYRIETNIGARKLSELLKKEINLTTTQCIEMGLVQKVVK